MANNTPYEVLSIASPCVDRLIRVPMEYVDGIPGKKGGAEAVDHPTLLSLIENSGGKEELVAGGAASNTIRGLANLGHSCALTGTLSNDHLAAFFLKSLQDLPITPLYQTVKAPTAQVLCLVTPDGDRTQRVFLGAADEMGPKQLDPAHFDSCRLLVLEGFSFRNEGLLERAMALGRKKGATIAFGLSSFEIVNSYRHRLLDILPQYVDLLFANKDEARALTGLEEKLSVIALSKLCKTVIVTHGSEGCWIGANSEAFFCPTNPLKSIDATGAGDLFMAGFLHGYLMGRPLSTCGKIGNLAGGAITQIIGPTLSEALWKDLIERMAGPH